MPENEQGAFLVGLRAEGIGEVLAEIDRLLDRLQRAEADAKGAAATIEEIRREAEKKPHGEAATVAAVAREMGEARADVRRMLRGEAGFIEPGMLDPRRVFSEVVGRLREMVGLREDLAKLSETDLRLLGITRDQLEEIARKFRDIEALRSFKGVMAVGLTGVPKATAARGPTGPEPRVVIAGAAGIVPPPGAFLGSQKGIQDLGEALRQLRQDVGEGTASFENLVEILSSLGRAAGIPQRVLNDLSRSLLSSERAVVGMGRAWREEAGAAMRGGAESARGLGGAIRENIVKQIAYGSAAVDAARVTAAFADEIDRLGKTAGKQASDFDRATKLVKDFGGEVARMQAELDRLGAAGADPLQLVKQGARVQAFADRHAALQRELDQTGRVTATTRSGINIYGQSLDEAIVRVFKYRIALTLLMQAQNVVAQSFRTLIGLQDQLARIRIIIPPTVGIDQLRDDLFNLAREVAGKVQDAADSFKTFAQAGFNVSQSMDLARAALIGVNVANLTAQESVNALLSAVFQFDVEAKNSLVIMDKLLALENSFATSSQDLAVSLQRSGAVVRTFGDSLDFALAAAIPAIEITRRTGREIGTALRTIFTRIAMPESIASLQNMGVAVFKASGEFRKLQDILTDLARIWPNLNSEQQVFIAQQLGGVRRVTEFLALMQGFDRVLDAVTISETAMGRALKANDLIISTLSKRWQILSTTVGQAASQAFERGLKPAAEAALVPLQAISSALAVLPGRLTSLTAFLLATVGLVKFLQVSRVSEGAVAQGLAAAISTEGLERFSDTIVEAIKHLNPFTTGVATGTAAVLTLTRAVGGSLRWLLALGKVVGIVGGIVTAAYGVFRLLSLATQEQADASVAAAGRSGELAESLKAALEPTEDFRRKLVLLHDEYGNFIAGLKRAAGLVDLADVLRTDPRDIAGIRAAHESVRQAILAEVPGLARAAELDEKNLKLLEGQSEAVTERVRRAKELAAINEVISIALASHVQRIQLVEDFSQRVEQTWKAIAAAMRPEPLRDMRDFLQDVLTLNVGGPQKRLLEKAGIDAASAFGRHMMQELTKAGVGTPFRDAARDAQKAAGFLADAALSRNLKDIGDNLLRASLAWKGAFGPTELDRFKAAAEVIAKGQVAILRAQLSSVEAIEQELAQLDKVGEAYAGQRAELEKAKFLNEKMVAIQKELGPLIAKDRQERQKLRDLQAAINRESGLMVTSSRASVEAIRELNQQVNETLTAFLIAAKSAPILEDLARSAGLIEQPFHAALDAFRQLERAIATRNIVFTEGLLGQRRGLNDQIGLIEMLGLAYRGLRDDQEALGRVLAEQPTVARERLKKEFEILAEGGEKVRSKLDELGEGAEDLADAGSRAAQQHIRQMAEEVRGYNEALAAIEGAFPQIVKGFRIDPKALFDPARMDDSLAAFKDITDQIAQYYRTTVAGAIREVEKESARLQDTALRQLRARHIEEMTGARLVARFLGETAEAEAELARIRASGATDAEEQIRFWEVVIERASETVRIEGAHLALMERRTASIAREQAIREAIAETSRFDQRAEATFLARSVEVRANIVALEAEIPTLRGEAREIAQGELDMLLMQREAIRDQVDLQVTIAEIQRRRLDVESLLTQSIRAGFTELERGLEGMRERERLIAEIRNLEDDIRRARKGQEPVADLLNRLRDAKDELRDTSFIRVIGKGLGAMAADFAASLRQRIVDVFSEDLARLLARHLGGLQGLLQPEGAEARLAEAADRLARAAQEGAPLFASEILSGSQAGSALFEEALVHGAARAAGILAPSLRAPGLPEGVGRGAVGGLPPALRGGAGLPRALTAAQQKQMDAIEAIADAGQRQAKEAGFQAAILQEEAARQRQLILKSLVLMVAQTAGAAIGGGGRGAQTGSMIGGILASLIPGVGPFLAPLGALAGGAIGGAFDRKFKEPFKDLEAAVKENTQVLTNTNRLLSLQNQLVNVPTTFQMPPGARGGFLPPIGGAITFAPVFNVPPGTSPGAIADEAFSIFERNYGRQVRTTRPFVSRFAPR